MARTPTKKQRPSSNPLPSDVYLTLGELGIEVEKVSRDEAWAICPNPKHVDRSPSWSVHLETGEHHCFSCGWGGNFLWLVMTVEDVEAEQGEEWIRKRGGISVARKKLQGEAYVKNKAVEVSEADTALFDTWIPQWALRARDLNQESCEAYGVLWDPERGNWIIPIRDPHTGALMGWQEKGEGKGNRHFRNWPPPNNKTKRGGVEKGLAVFGYHLLGDVGYLEESPLDCVRMHTYSLDGAVSGYGVHVTETQMGLIVERVKTLYVCLDNDAAGRRKEDEIWRNYRRHTRLMFANYEKTKKKDHGEMTPEEIEYSITNAISSIRFRPADED